MLAGSPAWASIEKEPDDLWNNFRGENSPRSVLGWSRCDEVVMFEMSAGSTKDF